MRNLKIVFFLILMQLGLAGCGSLINFGGHPPIPDPVKGGTITFEILPDKTVRYTLTQPDNPSEGACFKVRLRNPYTGDTIEANEADGRLADYMAWGWEIEIEGNVSGVEVPETPGPLKGLMGYSPIFWLGVAVMAIGVGMIIMALVFPGMLLWLLSWKTGGWVVAAGVFISVVAETFIEYKEISTLALVAVGIGWYLVGSNLKKETPHHLKRKGISK